MPLLVYCLATLTRACTAGAGTAVTVVAMGTAVACRRGSWLLADPAVCCVDCRFTLGHTSLLLTAVLPAAAVCFQLLLLSLAGSGPGHAMPPPLQTGSLFHCLTPTAPDP